MGTAAHPVYLNGEGHHDGGNRYTQPGRKLCVAEIDSIVECADRHEAAS